MHFLPLLEQKVGALDQAAPLQGWDLPDEFATLRQLLEARMGKKGLSSGATWRRQVTNLWAVGHGYWVGTSRIAEARICGGRDDIGRGG